MEATIRDVADLLEGQIEGAHEGLLTSFAGIEEAVAGQLTFLSNPSYEPHLYTTRASAVLVASTQKLTSALRPGTALIRVEDPYASMAKLMQAFSAATKDETTDQNRIHPTAVIHPRGHPGQGGYH